MLHTGKHESLKSLDTPKRGCCLFNEIDGIRSAEVREVGLRPKNNRIIPRRRTNDARKSDKITVVGASFRSNKVFRHNLIKRGGRLLTRRTLACL